MDKTNPYFSSLIDSWTQAQNQAWQTQARLFEETGAAFTKAFGTEDDTTPNLNGIFDTTWAQTRQAFDGWTAYLESVAPTGPDGAIGAEVLARLMDPGAWLNLGINEMNQNIESLAEGVLFADMWSAERGGLQASKEWLELRRHSLRYRYIIIGAWMRAFDRFFDKAKQDYAAGNGAPPDVKALTTLWLEFANEELLKTQRSTEFLEAQRDLLRASIDFRARQQHAVEQICEVQGIPTRTEVDDLHRTVTQLRREIRALKAERTRAPRAKAPTPTRRKTVKQAKTSKTSTKKPA